jgi:hypothetical protein
MIDRPTEIGTHSEIDMNVEKKVIRIFRKPFPILNMIDQ